MKLSTIFLLLLAFSLSACGLDASFATSTDKIAAAAAEIADFDLPADYSPEFTATVQDYSLVGYKPGSDDSHLYLVQSKNAADAEELARAIDDMAPNASSRGARMTVLETRQITVRDQAAVLVISEGTRGDGGQYRQAVLAFTGKTGPALLVFSTPLTTWNPETVDALVASIR